MSQVNKYADKAGYTADKNRKDTQSAVSYVEDDGVLIYDGVNTVIRKSAAGVGDLVVFDKTDSTLKFIKGDTLVTEKIPPQLIPVAVVYARQVDFTHTSFMDSSGIGVLLNRYKQMAASRGTVAYYGAGPQVRRILEMGGVSRLIKGYEDRESAIKG